MSQAPTNIPIAAGVVRMHLLYGKLHEALVEQVAKAKKAGAVGPFTFSVTPPAKGSGVNPFTEAESKAFQAVAAKVPQ